jgi:hypothetical protein
MRTSPALLATLLSLACGGTAAPPATTADAPAQAPDDPSSPPAATPGAPEDVSATMVARSSPAEATKAYLVAAQASKVDDMLALMTPECRDKERTWADGFTKNIADGKIKLKSYEMREPVVTDDTANVSVKAVFVADGVDDNEGMRFALKKQGDDWLIAEIR